MDSYSEPEVTAGNAHQSHLSRPNVILTGFMGTGKTTVGRLLAAALGYDFVDTDALIEERAGKTIAGIFAEEGEAAFRAWERAVAAELAGRRGVVVATGGRLMLDPANAAALEASAVVYCLAARPETIVARLQDELATRPLLAGSAPEARIRALLRERAESYGRFHIVDTDDRVPAEIAGQLANNFTRQI